MSLLKPDTHSPGRVIVSDRANGARSDDSHIHVRPFVGLGSADLAFGSFTYSARSALFCREFRTRQGEAALSSRQA